MFYIKPKKKITAKGLLIDKKTCNKTLHMTLCAYKKIT